MKDEHDLAKCMNDTERASYTELSTIAQEHIDILIAHGIEGHGLSPDSANNVAYSIVLAALLNTITDVLCEAIINGFPVDAQQLINTKLQGAHRFASENVVRYLEEKGKENLIRTFPMSTTTDETIN